jgi:iron-sulfur cluster insertion protein
MPSIILTEKAIKEINTIMKDGSLDPATTYFRARIVGGGCSGFQTKLDLDVEVTDKDEKWEQDGIKIAIDKRSLMYIEGATVDFIDDRLDKRGFFVDNPNAKTTCGCGSSFSM